MKFWHDGQENSTRIRNVEYCLPKMNELSKFLKSNGVDCESKIYDFSFTKQIPESIHIPYNIGEYKKSEKTNLIINENNDYDYIFMFDCDTFFINEDFVKILNLLKSVNKNEIITFDLAKLSEEDSKKVINNEITNFEPIDWWYAYAGDKKNGPFGSGHSGGIGGVYICDMNLIKSVGGFNEEYIGWGGEDGDMMGRLYESKKI